MKMHVKLIAAFATAALASIAGAQPSTTDSTTRSAGEAARDTANAAGRAASAAVTPGDQNMGRTPENRSGGLMGSDRTGTTSSTTTTTTDDTRSTRAARSDRG